MALAQKLHFSQAISVALQGDLAVRSSVLSLPVLFKGQGSGSTVNAEKNDRSSTGKQQGT